MRYYLLMLLLFINASVIAQVSTITPIEIGVNWHKTTHIIFPTSIKYFSTVSDFIVADDIDNILSIKANEENFEGKSSLSVATADGQFYAFSVIYTDTLINTNYYVSSKEVHKPQRININTKNDVHLLFPAEVKYIDYGSDVIEAVPSSDLQNIVRISAKKSFGYETNVSVALNNKEFYTFDFINDEQEQHFTHYIGSYLPESPVLLKKEDLTDITKDKIIKDMADKGRKIFNLGLEKNKVMFSIHNIFIRSDKLLFRYEMVNKSNIDYDIDYIKFYIIDRKKTKKEASQELEILPLFIDSFTQVVPGKSSGIFTVGFEKFTIPDNKYFAVEISEKNGGRHIYYTLINNNIINAEAF